MPVNDLEVTEWCLRIDAARRGISRALNDGHEHLAFTYAMAIEEAARKIQMRLNALRFARRPVELVL